MGTLTATAEATWTGNDGGHAIAELISLDGTMAEFITEEGVLEEGIAGALASVSASGSIADANLDGLLDEQINPTLLVPQAVGLRITVNGEVVNRSNIVGPWAIDLSIENQASSWAFNAAQQWGVHQVAFSYSPFRSRGNIFGRLPITIEGVYQLSDGAFVYIPLITEGICDSSPITLGPNQTKFYACKGVDNSGFWQAKPVTLVIPPGANMRRDTILKRLLQRAGFTRFRLIQCGKVNKEHQYVDADPFVAGREEMDIEGRTVVLDTEANVRNPRLGPPTHAAAYNLYEKDFLAVATVQLDPPVHPPTDIILTGSEQVTEDDDTPSRIVRETETKITAVIKPVYVGFSQNSDCSLNTITAPGGAATEILYALTKISQEFYRGVLVRELTKTWTYYNPIASRYKYDSSIPPVLICRGGGSAPTYVDAGASPSDSTTGRLLKRQEWQLFSETETWHLYDKPGYNYLIGGSTVVPGFGFPLDVQVHFGGTVNSDDDSGTWFKLGTITEQRGFYLPKESLKDATATGASWEEKPFRAGVHVLATGEGVIDDEDYSGVFFGFERFQPVSRVAELITADADGFQTGAQRFFQEWFLRPGSDFWYAGGGESSDIKETFITARTETVSYLENGEDMTTEVIVRLGFNGAPVEGQPPTETRTTPGSRPAVPRIEGKAQPIDPALYENAADAEAARRAPPKETRQIKIQLTDDGLEAFHPRRTIKTALDRAETIEELVRVGNLVLDEGSAIGFVGVLPCNFLLPRLMYDNEPIHIRYTPEGINHDFMLRSMSFSGAGPGTLATTTIAAKNYGAPY